MTYVEDISKAFETGCVSAVGLYKNRPNMMLDQLIYLLIYLFAHCSG